MSHAVGGMAQVLKDGAAVTIVAGVFEDCRGTLCHWDLPSGCWAVTLDPLWYPLGVCWVPPVQLVRSADLRATNGADSGAPVGFRLCGRPPRPPVRAGQPTRAARSCHHQDRARRAAAAAPRIDILEPPDNCLFERVDLRKCPYCFYENNRLNHCCRSCKREGWRCQTCYRNNAFFDGLCTGCGALTPDVVGAPHPPRPTSTPRVDHWRSPEGAPRREFGCRREEEPSVADESGDIAFAAPVGAEDQAAGAASHPRGTTAVTMSQLEVFRLDTDSDTDSDEVLGVQWEVVKTSSRVVPGGSYLFDRCSRRFEHADPGEIPWWADPRPAQPAIERRNPGQSSEVGAPSLA